MTDGSMRVGTAEREAAMKALDEHLASGRLTVDEYGDRAAKAASAVVAADLTELFTDLPAPHPVLAGGTPQPAAAPAPRADGDIARQAGTFLREWGPRLAAAAPLIAIALFFLTRQWVFFLLIPIVGALVYGGRRDR